MGKHAKPNPTTKRIAAAIAVGGGVVPATFVSAAAHAADGARWDRIAACESGDMNTPGSGRWHLPFGDGSSTGGLQIQQGTWDDFGGQRFAPQAFQASKAEQITVAERILAMQGPDAWTCNQPGHGIATGALDGGATTQAPAPVVPTPTPPRVQPTNPGAHQRTYTVVPGDYLIKIARHLGVSGGWQALYDVNREAVGPNPNLIHPGLVLVIPS